jgi:hypothetical protein
VTIFLERKFRTHSKKREEGRGKQFTGWKLIITLF